MTAAPDLAGLAPVLLGLCAGTLAKYGLQLEDGDSIVPRKVVGHCMMLALLGLIAEASCSLVPVPPTAHAIAGAGAAIASAKLVRMFRDRSERQARTKLGLDPEDRR